MYISGASFAVPGLELIAIMLIGILFHYYENFASSPLSSSTFVSRFRRFCIPEHMPMCLFACRFIPLSLTLVRHDLLLIIEYRFSFFVEAASIRITVRFPDLQKYTYTEIQFTSSIYSITAAFFHPKIHRSFKNVTLTTIRISLNTQYGC